MQSALVEIALPRIHIGKVGPFSAWRRALADVTGVPVRYALRWRPVALGATGAPGRLTFVEAETQDAAFVDRLTDAVRRGDWQFDPDDPLLVLLLLTVPGGTLQARRLGPIAERLVEVQPLLDALDDGRWGTTDVARLNAMMAAGFAAAADRGADIPIDGGYIPIDGGYEPSGWWTDLDRQLP
jgi:hypothetical protein